SDAAPKERRFVEVGQRGDDATEFTVLSAHQVVGTLTGPQIIEAPVNVSMNGKREFAVREKRPNSFQAEIGIYEEERVKGGHGPMPAVWIDWLEIEGPVTPQPPTAELLVAPTQDGAGARAVIDGFATRAFRGKPPSPEYLDRLLVLFEAGFSRGDPFNDAL